LENREEKTMKSKFAGRLRALGVLGIVAALILTACGGASGSTSTSGGKLAPGASFKLGVSLTFNNTDFWTNYIAYETQFAKQYNAQLIGPLVANNNAAQQITDVHTLIQEGAQALIINPVDSSAIAPALDYAASRNIPVITVDVAPSSGSGHVYMIVRADNIAYGQESCTYIAEHATSKTGHIALLDGDLASVNGLDRTNGCLQVLKSKYPGFQVVQYATKWDTPTAVNDAKTALSTYPDLRGIYVQWSAPEDGILAAEKADGKLTPVGSSPHIVLIGNDGTPHEHALIRANQLDASISQPANAYAQYAIFYARAALEGKTYSAGETTDHGSKIVNLLGNLEDALPAPVVDKSNVNDPKLWGNAKSSS
jgi:ribose transport system substrate-binding protein